MKNTIKYRAFGLLLIAAMVIAALPMQSAQAATLDVCSTCTYTTIQSAIDAASAGDTISVAGETFEEDVVINKSLTLQGAGSSATFLNQLSTNPVITVSADNVIIKDLSITDAVEVTEGIRVVGATSGLTIENLYIGKLGKGSSNAFGINIKNAFTGLTVTGSTFMGMDPGALTRAIGIYAEKIADATQFAVSGSTFTNVFVGVYLNGNVEGFSATGNNFGPMDIKDCATAASGIYFGDGPSLFSVNDVLVDNNTFTSYCRGVYMWEYGADGGNYGSMTFSNNTFLNSIYSSGIRIIAGMDQSYVNPDFLTGPVNISGNSFTQNAPIINGAGVSMIDLRATAPDLTDAISIKNNSITYEGAFTASTFGVLLQGPFTNVNIEENNFDGNHVGGASQLMPPTSGIVLVTNSVQYGPILPTAVVNVLDNTISELESGLTIFDKAYGVYGGLPVGIDMNVNGNKIVDNTHSIYSGSGEIVDATLNWWGSASGPVDIQGEVNSSPWYADEAMTVTAAGEPGDYTFETGATAVVMNALIAQAPPKSTVRLVGELPGGLLVDRDDIVIDLEGATVGAGSPAFEITGDDVTITGGKLEGDGLSPGVLVQAGAHNFTLDGVEITGWADGVQVAGPVESLKIVNNWIHTNNNAGLKVDATPTGVVTINGNLFKNNTNFGVFFTPSTSGDTLIANYNSWGHRDGPHDTTGIGDKINSYDVVVQYWNFSEIFMDMDPDIAGDNFERHITSLAPFQVSVNAEAVRLQGLSFKFKYDTNLLNLVGDPTFSPSWDELSGDDDYGRCTKVEGLPAGEVEYFCTRLYNNSSGYEFAWSSLEGGEKIATFTFEPINSGNAIFDVVAGDSLGSAAVGGVKVWVNNAGFNDPSTLDRDVSDLNDGELDIDISQFSGFVDLQGRPDDSGAAFTVYDDSSGTTLLASATSAASGKYTTEYLTGQYMNFMDTFWIKVDRALFLPTFFMQMDLNGTPLTTVNQLLLLGGDANDNDVIDIGDATCIGGAYGSTTPAACSGAGWNDVNGDGVVNIYDLTLMGGNFGKTHSSVY